MRQKNVDDLKNNMKLFENDEEEIFEDENDQYDIIRDSMAKSLYASAWADWIEEEQDGFPSGEEVMELVPDGIPPSAKETAEEIIRELERRNAMSITELYEKAMEADGYTQKEIESDEYADIFGHYMALGSTGGSTGTGVQWEDDHENFDIDYPHIDYTYFDIEDEYLIPLNNVE